MEDMEINLTPIMNLVVVLIPLLLQAMVVIKLGRIDYEPPPLAVAETPQDDAEGDGGSDTPTMLNLTVNVIDTSIQVSIYGELEGENYWEIPLTPGSEFDFARLQEILIDIKLNQVGEPIRTEQTVDPRSGEDIVKEIYNMEDAAIVRIAAAPYVSYQNMVTLLDVTRNVMIDGNVKWLFPQPVLGTIGTALIAVQ